MTWHCCGPRTGGGQLKDCQSGGGWLNGGRLEDVGLEFVVLKVDDLVVAWREFFCVLVCMLVCGLAWPCRSVVCCGMTWFGRVILLCGVLCCVLTWRAMPFYGLVMPLCGLS